MCTLRVRVCVCDRSLLWSTPFILVPTIPPSYTLCPHWHTHTWQSTAEAVARIAWEALIRCVKPSSSWPSSHVRPAKLNPLKSQKGLAPRRRDTCREEGDITAFHGKLDARSEQLSHKKTSPNSRSFHIVVWQEVALRLCGPPIHFLRDTSDYCRHRKAI